MKILLLLVSLNLMASVSTFQSQGQPLDGSFYLGGSRNHFKNPAKLAEMYNQVYAESIGEAGYKTDDFLFGFTRKKLFGAYQFNEMAGLGAYVSALNGKGVSSYGVSFGINMSDYNFYGGIEDTDKTSISPYVGMGMTIFEYKGLFCSNKGYDFTVGYGKEYEIFFGDITYNQKNSDSRKLALTIGGRAWLAERWVARGSASKELFFKGSTKINAGLTWLATDKIELGVSHSLTAFSMASPKYNDFDVKASLAYKF